MKTKRKISKARDLELRTNKYQKKEKREIQRQEKRQKEQDK